MASRHPRPWPKKNFLMLAPSLRHQDHGTRRSAYAASRLASQGRLSTIDLRSQELGRLRIHQYVHHHLHGLVRSSNDCARYLHAGTAEPALLLDRETSGTHPVIDGKLKGLQSPLAQAEWTTWLRIRLSSRSVSLPMRPGRQQAWRHRARSVWRLWHNADCRRQDRAQGTGTYGSLSAIAKRITSAHWSSRRFFGL